ncbi:type IV toxin-antitoxin system AbiEi family antitoxin domain-containing protein [Microlunatus soli]|uniref:Transcriptional regulator, AbiEi antitoxin, Type IV TA system n=1 Tax=Microlunatus soli TaxID=630515 RepID=A0A1H1MDA7_9ACTN|nr:type IV toxin-antitoxin system AbiEi family antitoxin domain-containing protein [Microlunatus soli]SDR84345.1 Transcriptional regulator, AbiEi antitoxin, Type IV TA system [Microlunatus soli]
MRTTHTAAESAQGRPETLVSPLPEIDQLDLPAGIPFTRAMAIGYGIGPNVLTRLVRQGVLRRVLRGVYVDNAVPDGIGLRSQAISLAIPSDAIVTDSTAAWLYGADVRPRGAHLREPEVHCFRPPGRSRVRRPSVNGGERTLSERDIQIVHGITVTSPLRTACDLGRLMARDDAIGALDAMLRHGNFDQQELIGEVRRFRGYRGVVQLRELVRWADGTSESMGESTLRLRWIDEGLPSPELQIVVSPTGRWQRYRLDLGIRRVRYAAEYDGDDWHSTEEQVAADRARDEDLAADGWIVDHFRRGEVYHSRANVVGNQLRAGLRRAARRSGSAAGR